MATQPSTKKKSSSHTSNQETINQDRLVAIVLLDSYSTKFQPFSSDRAECLLPLIGGKTLLDSNLEFLCNNKVEEIVLFCTRHSTQIKTYLDKSNWKQRAHSLGIEIHFLYNFKCRSLGDAIREIDAKGHVRSTFILITATGIVSNFSLAENLEHHRAVSKADRNVVMTILTTPKLGDFGCASKQAASSLIVHNANKRILHYHSGVRRRAAQLVMPSTLLSHGYSSIKQAIQQQQVVESANARFNFPDNNTAITGYQGGNSQTITHLTSIQLRTDLIESQIYLCNSHVLGMFTDNFDQETMEQFINGVLADEEVSGFVVHMDTLSLRFGSHFSVISDLNSYYIETMRLLSRADLTLDLELFRRHSDRLNVYTSKSTLKFGDNCRLGRNVFIESGCRIGENCEIENCIIAANCQLGPNVKLTNSIVWPNSKIGPGNVINACLIGFGVRIGSNVKICENCVLGNEVQVKNNTVISQRGVYVKKEISTSSAKVETSTDSASYEVKEDNYWKLILRSRLESGDDEMVQDEEDNEFGSDVDDQRVEDEDEEESVGSASSRNSLYDTAKNKHFLVWRGRNALRKSLSHDTESEPSEDSEESEDDSHHGGVGGALGDDDDDDHGDRNQEEVEIFLSEVTELLQEALNTNMDPSNLILEINGRKHANNIPIDDLNFYLAKTMFNLPTLGLSNDQLLKLDYLKALNVQIKRQTDLLANYYTRTKKSQHEFLNSHLEFFTEKSAKLGSNQFIDSFYVKTLHHLFNEFEFLSQDAILEWYDKQTSKANETNETTKYAIGKLKPFIEWLQEDEDEEDDE